MEGERRGKASLMCLLLAGLLSQGFVTLVMSRKIEGFADEKNYYSPDPHVGSPPKHSHHRKPSCPTPSHGGSGGTPSQGGGGGGGSYGNPPPSEGSGGYYPTPPVTITPPYYPTPPVTITPPYSAPPVDPGTPTTPTIPAPPLIPDPNIPPFFIGPYSYWSTHPAAIWAIFGYWGTVGGFFGAPAIAPFGTNLSLQEALANTRTDGFGALYREGTAAFLNSMVNKKFAFSTQQVRDAFTSAIVSNKAAAAQAQLFKLANEGHLKH